MKANRPEDQADFAEKAYQNAMNSPQGKYLNVQDAKINYSEVMLMNHPFTTGITSAVSVYPVLGGAALNPCIALALYNPKTKALLIHHEPLLDGKKLQEFAARVRSSTNDMLHVHVIGGVGANDIEEEFYKKSLISLAAAIASDKNMRLKTFDILNKPHPSCFAIDARNGRLIRGSSNIATGVMDEEEYLLDCDCADNSDFDGTAPEYLKSKTLF